VGGFSLWAAARSQCRILALEPNPATHALLLANVRIGRLDSRIEVRPWALAGSKGTRRFHPADDSAASALSASSPSGDRGKEVEVQAVTLEEAIAHTGFPRIDVLKMDIEGAEHEVFGGISRETLRLVNHWIVECHPAPGSTREAISRVLSSASFDVETIEKPLGMSLVFARR
jgi:FkbM family methyltransferase